jgi:ubiquinone biosynthesis protein COQ4
MKKLVKKVRMGAKGLRFMFRFVKLTQAPNDTMRVFKMLDAMIALAKENGVVPVELVRNQPGIKEMVESRYVAPSYKVEDLGKYPVGSLGYAYYRHMHDNGFTPDFFPTLPPGSDQNYFALRIRQTHDIWHVVAGVGTDIVGEIALQAFYAGQLAIPSSSAIISAGIFYTIRHNEIYRPMMDGITAGYECGKNAHKIAAARWEEMWERPLSDIRREYNIVPVSDLYDFKPELVAVS